MLTVPTWVFGIKLYFYLQLLRCIWSKRWNVILNCVPTLWADFLVYCTVINTHTFFYITLPTVACLSQLYNTIKTWISQYVYIYIYKCQLFITLQIYILDIRMYNHYLIHSASSLRSRVGSTSARRHQLRWRQAQLCQTIEAWIVVSTMWVSSIDGPQRRQRVANIGWRVAGGCLAVWRHVAVMASRRAHLLSATRGLFYKFFCLWYYQLPSAVSATGRHRRTTKWYNIHLIL